MLPSLGANATILPSWTLAEVVLAPGGALPSYAHGYYARDNAFYLSWDEVSRERETFRAWIDTHVMRSSAIAVAVVGAAADEAM